MGPRKKTRHATAGPLVVVGSLTGRHRGSGKGWKTGAQVLAGTARAVPDRVAKVVAGPLPKGVAKRVPSRRKRKKMVKTLTGDIERLSGLASGLSTVLGLAATGGELLSVLRDRQEPGGRDEDAAGERQPGRAPGTPAARGPGATSEAHDPPGEENADDELAAGQSQEEDEGGEEGPTAGYDDEDEGSSDEDGAEESSPEVGDDEHVRTGGRTRRAS